MDPTILSTLSLCLRLAQLGALSDAEPILVEQGIPDVRKPEKWPQLMVEDISGG